MKSTVVHVSTKSTNYIPRDLVHKDLEEVREKNKNYETRLEIKWKTRIFLKKNENLYGGIKSNNFIYYTILLFQFGDYFCQGFSKFCNYYNLDSFRFSFQF